jgi:glycogen debranching enzyme
MKTKTGFQGCRQTYDTAISKRNEIQRKYYAKEMTYDESRVKEDEAMFVMTWEDTLSNLSYVMKHVKKQAPEIISQNITPIIRKGRRDVFVVSENNKLFKETFYRVLEELVEIEKEKHKKLQG